MQDITYWNFDKENIREEAIDMRARQAINYEKKILSTEKGFNQMVYDYRYDCLKIINKIIGQEIRGNVLEIGAGTAICSCHLTKFKDVVKVYALEYSKLCVEELITFVIKKFKLPEKLENKIYPIVGSFNNIKFPDESIDFVFAMSSLHHSEDREETLKEAYRILKIGGYLIAIDKANFNYLTNKQLNEQLDIEYSDKVKKRYGYEPTKKYTRRMNSEHEPLLAEWEYLLTKIGFYQRVFWFQYFKGIKKFFWWNSIGKLFFKLYGNKLLKRNKADFFHLKIPYYPWFCKNPPLKFFLFIAKKEPYIKMP